MRNPFNGPCEVTLDGSCEMTLAGSEWQCQGSVLWDLTKPPPSMLVTKELGLVLHGLLNYNKCDQAV